MDEEKKEHAVQKKWEREATQAAFFLNLLATGRDTPALKQLAEGVLQRAPAHVTETLNLCDWAIAEARDQLSEEAYLKVMQRERGVR